MIHSRDSAELGPISARDMIREQLGSIGQAALDAGTQLRPPVLALGVSERVGSNWFLDTLSRHAHTHNEPFRQQLHASHPLSTIVSSPEALAEYKAEEMHPYESYWLTNFVVSKYSVQPQVIKETNLFFATDNLLGLFPDSRALVLTRCPVGIASSFTDGDLFRKWNYAERYNQLKSITLQPQFEEYGFIFSGEHDPGSLRKLVRLVLLNTLLLSKSLEGREYITLKYEDNVVDRDGTLAAVSGFLAKAGIELSEKETEDINQTEHLFSTRKKKTDLKANLDKEDIDTISSEVRRLLADSLSVLTVSQYEQVQALVEIDNPRYSSVGRLALKDKYAAPEAIPSAPEFEFVQNTETGLEWSNQPVSNKYFVKFLNAMYQEGVPNVINGTQLFVNENMIPARGGRIWFNSNRGIYEVTPGYDDYPVYWVTWLGAAAYARFAGARLPDRQEFIYLVGDTSQIDFESLNCAHKLDDANIIGANPPNSDGIYDLLGNVASWCRDGYSEVPVAGVNRYIYGTAWNRSGTIEEIEKQRARPLSGCSRSVGVRLIADRMHALSSTELAERFDGWFALMANHKDLARSDRYIVDQLIH